MPVKKSERVQEIPLSELHPFKNHPFRVVDDEAMQRTVESVAQFGELAPALARPRSEGGYELVAGHRRMRASELAGLETMPVIIRPPCNQASFPYQAYSTRTELSPYSSSRRGD